MPEERVDNPELTELNEGSLDAMLRQQARAAIRATRADLSDRTLAAWRSEQRSSLVIPASVASGLRVNRWMAAAACVALVGAAAMLAKVDGREKTPMPSASAVLSSSLRGLPRQPSMVMKLAATPIRKEAKRMADGPMRVLGGLDLFPKTKLN